MTDASYTVTGEEYNHRILDISGTLTGPQNVILPHRNIREYVVNNNTGQTLTLKTVNGTGIAIPTVNSATVRCDGTDILRVTANVDPTV
jgi:hypothetical protein